MHLEELGRQHTFMGRIRKTFLITRIIIPALIIASTLEEINGHPWDTFNKGPTSSNENVVKYMHELQNSWKTPESLEYCLTNNAMI